MGNTRDYHLILRDPSGGEISCQKVYDYLDDLYETEIPELNNLDIYQLEDLLCDNSSLSTKWFDYESFLIFLSSIDEFKDHVFELFHKDEDGYVGRDESGQYLTMAKNGFVITEEYKLIKPDSEEMKMRLDNMR